MLVPIYRCRLASDVLTVVMHATPSRRIPKEFAEYLLRRRPLTVSLAGYHHGTRKFDLIALRFWIRKRRHIVAASSRGDHRKILGIKHTC
jgi:hypothetical protein